MTTTKPTTLLLGALVLGACGGGGEEVDWDDYGNTVHTGTSTNTTGGLGPDYTFTGTVDCDQVHDDAYDECISSGGTAVDCTTTAEDARTTCEESVDPAAAECREVADAVYDDCIDRGGNAIDCRQTANIVYSECIEG